MGSLDCPLCCGESFPNQESLKYHLLSVTDNIYCPDCGKRFDTIPSLAKHLNGFCGKDVDSDEEMDSKEEIIATLQQADGSHIVIVQDEDNQLDLSNMEQCQEDGSVRGEDDPMNYQIELIEPMVGESIMPDDTEIRLDHVHESENDKNEFLEEQPIELKIPESVADLEHLNENCEQFTCSTCNMTFTSIMEHIREYHDDQQVIIEIPDVENKDTLEEEEGTQIVTNCVTDENNMIEIDSLGDGEDPEKINEYLESEGLGDYKDKILEELKHKTGRNADIIGTIKHEQCLDQKGMRYVRKVVQIEKFWEKNKTSEDNLNKVAAKRFDIPSNHVLKNPINKRFKGIKSIPEGLLKIIGGSEAVTDEASIERLLTEAIEADPSITDSEDCPLEVRYLVEQDGSAKIPIFVCKLCRSEHSSIAKYLKHSCKSEKYFCDECGEFFNSTRALKSHKVKFHAEKAEKKLYVKKILDEPVICEFCDTPFWTLRSLKMHKRMHLPPTNDSPRPVRGNDSVNYICTICNTLCKTKRTLIQHQKIHEKNLTEIEKPELLDESGISLLSSSVAVCKICADSFDTDEKLMEHWNECHADMTDAEIGDPTKFVCQVCGEKVYRQFQDVHMQQHCTMMKYNCKICNRSFNTEHSRKLHARIHTEGKPLTCAICKEPFLDVDTLKEHMQNHSNERPYACSVCGRRFTRPHEKVKHERIHTGEKPHVCSVCGMRFRVNYCLTLHMRTHTGVRPYQCDHCGKRFRAHNGYSQHIKIHSDERAFQCPYCPKSFKTVVQLAGHRNSHTKPYPCEECNRPFASLYSLRNHMKSHDPSGNGKDTLKFSCEICGASYARRFALRDHMKSQHNEEYIPSTSEVIYDDDEEAEA